MRKLLFIFLLIFPVAASAQQPNASDIFKKSAEVYSGCRSYSDEVGINYRFQGVAFPFPVQHFHTAYVSPDRFRFEIEAIGRLKPMIVWKDGDLVGSSGGSGPYRPTSLDNALLTIAFASHGGSLTVPQ